MKIKIIEKLKIKGFIRAAYRLNINPLPILRDTYKGRWWSRHPNGQNTPCDHKFTVCFGAHRVYTGIREGRRAEAALAEKPIKAAPQRWRH